MRSPLTTGTKRLHLAPVALVTGVAAAALLSMSLTGTLSGFVASITNSTNTAATGSLVMQEQNSGATVTCLSTDGTGNGAGANSATCAGINKFGGLTAMVPNQSVTTNITIKNVGTVSATTFKLTPGATCTQTPAGGGTTGLATDLCAKLNVVITSGATNVFTGTLASLVSGGAITIPGAVAVNASVPFSFVVTLDTSAGNPYQGLAASLPLTWSFAS